MLLVPHIAAELPIVDGEEQYTVLEDWYARLRSSSAVP